jgi:hypothetical protein
METGRWGFQFYLDGGYAASSNGPDNGSWRSKSTTNKLDSPELNLAMAEVGKRARPESRWGFTFGLQTGVDTEGLVPSADELSNADSLRHLYRANGSYRFGTGREQRLTFGLINSYIGYESYLAQGNPNYTRGYILDTVPYFLVGTEFGWTVNDDLVVNFYLVTGWNYLAHPNDVPSTGAQVTWRVTPRLALRQNFYYGPDQANTSLDHWRFYSGSVAQWKSDRWLVAAAFDHVTERQADAPGQSRLEWTAIAMWVRWQASRRLSVALRPEVLDDDDGLATDFRQRIEALTATLKYELLPKDTNDLQLALEIRRDRSTGPDGGFFEGPTNRLVEYQNLVLFGMTWKFKRIYAD